MDKKKILIIDDEETNIVLIQAVLKKIGCESIVARDGEEGLALAKSELPDLVVLDVMMPKLNGFKVCGLLRTDKRFGKTPIVILSSRAGADDKELSQEAGADVYMLKPVDQEKLVVEIKRLLGV